MSTEIKKDLGFEITKYNTPINPILEIKNTDKMQEYIIIASYNPFGNCQIYSIGYFNNLFKERYKSIALDILLNIQSICGKNQLIIDIYERYIPNLLAMEIFDPKDIKIQSKYINTVYNSKMVVLLIDTRNLKSKITASFQRAPVIDKKYLN